MVTITRENIGKAGACMFCPTETREVNVIASETLIVRICDNCLHEIRLTKRALDGAKSAPKNRSISGKRSTASRRK